jgi:hypothetical protein
VPTWQSHIEHRVSHCARPTTAHRNQGTGHLSPITNLRCTIRDCEFFILPKVRFPRGSADVSRAEGNLDEIASTAQKVLRLPQRRLLARHSDSADGPTTEGRRQLALRRAIGVRGMPVQRGLSECRIDVRANEPGTAESSTDSRGSVEFKVEPSRPLREDLNPESDKYRQFCGAFQ